MKDLLANYSVNEIIIFIITLALAIKGCVSFFDWVMDRLRKVFNKEQKDKDLKEGIIYGLAALSMELFLIVILILVKNKKKLVALSEKFKDNDIDNEK